MLKKQWHTTRSNDIKHIQENRAHSGEKNIHAAKVAHHAAEFADPARRVYVDIAYVGSTLLFFLQSQ